MFPCALITYIFAEGHLFPGVAARALTSLANITFHKSQAAVNSTQTAMTYSVLLLGASGTIGTKIAAELAIHKDELKRVAYLTPLADAGPDKEEKYKALKIERIVGSLEDPSSYQGFNIVVSAVGDALCASQPTYMDAAFAAGVKHFYPAECTMSL